MEDIKTSEEQLLRRELIEANDKMIDLFKYGYILMAKTPANNDEEAQYTREASTAFRSAEMIGKSMTSRAKAIARSNIKGVI